MRKSRWSDSEVSNLQAFYPAIGAKELRQLLPERTTKAIKDKAGHLGIGKSHERLREQGRENVMRRWHPPTIET